MVTRVAPVRALVYPRTGAKVYVGDAREVLARLLDHSVDCRVTSPAYWDLRDYHLPPVFWGFDPDRDHRWAHRGHDGSGASALDRPSKLPMVAPRGSAADDVGSFCLLCEAWLGSLGLEPTPPLYVEHLVDVSRQLRRVLKQTGTLTSATATPADVAARSSTNKHPRVAARPRIAVPSRMKPKDLIGVRCRVEGRLSHRVPAGPSMPPPPKTEEAA